MIHARIVSRAVGIAAVAAIFALTLYGCHPTVKEPPPANPTGPDRGLVIEIQPAGTKPNPDPFTGHLFKGADPATKGQDHVRWHNVSGVSVTLHFTSGWPFMETQQDIVIPVGDYSAWFSLDLTKPNTTYGYHIDPVPTDPGHGPGDPGITGEP